MKTFPLFRNNNNLKKKSFLFVLLLFLTVISVAWTSNSLVSSVGLRSMTRNASSAVSNHRESRSRSSSNGLQRPRTSRSFLYRFSFQSYNTIQRSSMAMIWPSKSQSSSSATPWFWLAVVSSGEGVVGSSLDSKKTKPATISWKREKRKKYDDDRTSCTIRIMIYFKFDDPTQGPFYI